MNYARRSWQLRAGFGSAVLAGLLLAGLLLGGCSGSSGDDGTSEGTLGGIVTNSLTGEAVSGATVTTVPDASGAVMTEADGSYSLVLPVGNYDVMITADHFVPDERSVSIVAARETAADADLDPVAPVVIEASVDGAAVPGATLMASADITVLDGSAVQSTTWTQTNSVGVVISSPDTTDTDVDLPDLLAYKDELLVVLAEPPISEDELPANVELPEGDFPAGIPDRFGVVGASPFAIETASEVTLTMTVVTSSGTYTSEVDIDAALPFKPSSGLKAVAIGLPVLLHGRAHVDEDNDDVNDETNLPVTYDWALAPPVGSAAVLVDAASRDPYFIPDIVGEYTVTVTDTTQLPGTDVVTIEIEAGRWEGAITGQDADGRPLAAGCTNCHDDVTAPDKFTPWAQTGHAEIFTNNLNNSTHYGENCFSCHLLGFDPDVDNGGADDVAEYPDFLASGLLNNPGDNWTVVLNDFPSVAQLANVQCEHCHGPQFGGSHPDTGNVRRTSLSADVCGQCHGEPLRHARFQQWQLSAHANYELAQEEGGSGNCSRCHTANGFLTWLPILLDDDPLTDPTASITVTWSEDETHPQTCAACHDPHSIGTTSGADTNATVRISGNTPPLIAGFTVIGAGKGAICMTCHNSRRGLRNDANIGDTISAARAPHGSAQADVIMGQNAFFVTTGNRGNHSLVQDTCVNCHMRQTPPPNLLSYNSGGTNHTFAASDQICSNCHGESFDATGVQTVFDALMAEVKLLVEEAILLEITNHTLAGNSVVLGSSGVTITDAATIVSIDFSEFRGRQAVTVTTTTDTVGPLRATDIDVLDSAMTNLGNLYTAGPIDDRVPLAAWNYLLAFNDGSRGIHNPSYIQGLLTAAINQLNSYLP